MQERNLSQEFEALLNGRRYSELVGEEAGKAVELLTEIVKTKPLKDLTKTEVEALIEELSEDIAWNVLKGGALPEDWKAQTLDYLESSDERNWGWSWASILDLYLHNIDIWDCLEAEESDVVAKTIIHYLQGDKDWFDYYLYYLEQIEDEENDG